MFNFTSFTGMAEARGFRAGDKWYLVRIGLRGPRGGGGSATREIGTNGCSQAARRHSQVKKKCFPQQSCLISNNAVDIVQKLK